jgi:hypothetical protein
MTESQAKALRDKRKQQGDAVPCEHPYLELEKSEKGYLTGHYHCTDCGEPVAKQVGTSGESTSADQPPPGDPLPC